MSEKELKKLIEAVKEQLRQKIREEPKKPVFFLGGVPYLPKAVLEHIEKMDDFGKLCLKEILKTATDMWTRRK